ncbi:hypothetical protein BGW80DRAFT_1454968 [Lactifluus volemus]|nr:hypothetical protein BGW80DRAFT_1454968 [Lactifluus volemus]
MPSPCLANPAELEVVPLPPIWILGDTVLEKRDRQVHERWTAGLGVTFVVANVLSVLILCTAIELYRRTKATHPGLIAKIRARHIANKGRNNLALRWVGRFESRSPPQDASPRDRMIARMEWNERMERRGVPWLLEIGIPGLLDIALCLFFTGAIMRSFP